MRKKLSLLAFISNSNPKRNGNERKLKLSFPGKGHGNT